MQKICFVKRIFGGLGSLAIATAILPINVEAQTKPTQIAQSVIGQCRAANRPTPVFAEASTVSSALRILANSEKVTLSTEVQDGFVAISSPIRGYVQTGVLKTCATPPRPKTACRLLKNPAVINIRNAPKIPAGNADANVIASAKRGDRVYAVLKPNGSLSTAVADGYNWVEVDLNRGAPASTFVSGWLYNSRVGSSESNLAYCPE